MAHYLHPPPRGKSRKQEQQSVTREQCMCPYTSVTVHHAFLVFGIFFFLPEERFEEIDRALKAELVYTIVHHFTRVYRYKLLAPSNEYQQLCVPVLLRYYNTRYTLILLRRKLCFRSRGSDRVVCVYGGV